jgi:DNA primase
MSRIKELRMKLKEEDIKYTLGKLGVFPELETDKALIYPTVCHNAEGGSPKLYYYKNEKIFKCYTGCNHQFDIFDLLQKIHRLRGHENFTVKDAIEFTGVEQEVQYSKEVYDDLEYLKKLSAKSSLENLGLASEEHLDEKILNRYKYNKIGVASWLNEGISENAMKKFKIGYDGIKNAITIPNYDHEGHLVGIRGRFLNPDSPAKYMPMIYENKILSHRTGKIFYGFWENKENIKRVKVAVIFEGEKSVLKMEDFYPDNNIGLATTGKKISLEHLNSLIELGIKEVVLAYDKDYKTTQEMKDKLIEYDSIVNLLKPYFNVSIIMDYDGKLGPKDSPADKGKEVFDYLLKNRVKR